MCWEKLGCRGWPVCLYLSSQPYLLSTYPEMTVFSLDWRPGGPSDLCSPSEDNLVPSPQVISVTCYHLCIFYCLSVVLLFGDCRLPILIILSHGSLQCSPKSYMPLTNKSSIFGLCGWCYGALWWWIAWHSAQYNEIVATAATQDSLKLPEQVEIQSWWLRNDVLIIFSIGIGAQKDRLELKLSEARDTSKSKTQHPGYGLCLPALGSASTGLNCSGSTHTGQGHCEVLWQASSPPGNDNNSSFWPSPSHFFISLHT